MLSFLESNGNENTTCKNFWEAAQAFIKEKFILISAYIKKSQQGFRAERGHPEEQKRGRAKERKSTENHKRGTGQLKNVATL
jgi:hypothetical protein